MDAGYRTAGIDHGARVSASTGSCHQRRPARGYETHPHRSEAVIGLTGAPVWRRS